MGSQRSNHQSKTKREYLAVGIACPNHDGWRPSVLFKGGPRSGAVGIASRIQNVGASRILESKVTTLAGDRGTLLPRIDGGRTGPKITEKSNFCGDGI